MMVEVIKIFNRRKEKVRSTCLEAMTEMMDKTMRHISLATKPHAMTIMSQHYLQPMCLEKQTKMLISFLHTTYHCQQATIVYIQTVTVKVYASFFLLILAYHCCLKPLKYIPTLTEMACWQ